MQSMTGDNWSEDCRNLMAESGQGAMVGIFYVRFSLFCYVQIEDVELYPSQNGFFCFLFPSLGTIQKRVSEQN